MSIYRLSVIISACFEKHPLGRTKCVEPVVETGKQFTCTLCTACFNKDVAREYWSIVKTIV